MLQYIRRALRMSGQVGATAVEYALMVAAIAAVVGVAAFALGRTSSNSLKSTCNAIATSGGTGTSSSC